MEVPVAAVVGFAPCTPQVQAPIEGHVQAIPHSITRLASSRATMRPSISPGLARASAPLAGRHDA